MFINHKHLTKLNLNKQQISTTEHDQNKQDLSANKTKNMTTKKNKNCKQQDLSDCKKQNLSDCKKQDLSDCKQPNMTTKTRSLSL